MKQPALRSQSTLYSIVITAAFVCFMNVVAVPASLFSQSFETDRGEFSVLLDTPTAALMNINNIVMWANDNGVLERNNYRQSAGVVFPRGTSTLVFEGGLVWGGYVRDGMTPELRTGGQAQTVGTLAGRITESHLPENRYTSSVKVFRIRRDWKTADLRLDAAETFEVSIYDVTENDVSRLRAQYASDWLRWPWQKGAPYYERNGIPGYQPDTSGSPTSDEPGLLEADQVAWLVCNDLTYASRFSAAPAIGIEQQITCWAYAQPGMPDNVIFQQHKIIYKGTYRTPPTARIDSMYIAKWVDINVGSVIDDYVGCDPGNNFSYGYNSSEVDFEYNKYGLLPPAIGYDVLQGPRVQKPGGYATWNFSTVPGYENLPMTSFVALADSEFRDQPRSTFHWWNALRGYQPKPENPPQCYVNPFTEQCTSFPLSGDPRTYQGWVDGRVVQRGDRRLLISSGPFQMMLGDTQQVVYALIAAEGHNRIERLNRLDSIDFAVQTLFERNFEQADTLPVPTLRIAELDQTLILDWEHDIEQMREIESTTSNGYRFETYKIYQYKSASLSSEYVEFPPFDPIAPRLIHQTTDYLRNKLLANGTKYYYAVTAVLVRTLSSGEQHRIETPRTIVTAVPHSPNPGTVYPYQFGDEITNTKNLVGYNDAPITVEVQDPSKVSGDSLKITFSWKNVTEEKPRWNLINMRSNDTLLDFASVGSPPRHVISEGITVSVSQQGFGLKGVFQTRFNGLPSNERVFNVPNSGGNYMFIARDESQLDFVSGSSAVDKDIEFRFEGDSSWALLRRTSVASSAWVRVPFSVWQMDRDDTSPIGRRIYPVITRQGQDSVWRTRVLLDRGYNGKPLKEFYPISVVADSYCVPTIGRCFGTYIVADTLHPDYPFIKALLYTRTESNERSLGLYEVYIADLDEDGAPAPRGTFVRFKRYKDIFDGDEKLILPSAITYNDAHAMRVEIEKVNVFPNPYYGVNRAETNNSERFVTFNHLPYQAIIRIFNLAGVMVKTIQKNDETQFTAWNLNNENNLPVASGLYIAQIEMRDSQGSPLGTKELKLMIVQGERFR